MLTERNRKIVEYLPLVASVLRRLGLPEYLTNEMHGFGLMGLIAGATHYDPAQGNFPTYAMLKIRGAILDELRARDTLPRHLRQRLVALNRAVMALEALHGRAPTDPELCVYLHIAPWELVKWQAIKTPQFVSLDMERGGADNRHSLYDEMPSGDEDIRRTLEGQERRALAARLILDLPRPLWQVMTHLYKDRLNLRQTGRRLGVSESRVCQMRKKAVRLLRCAARLRSNI